MVKTWVQMCSKDCRLVKTWPSEHNDRSNEESTKYFNSKVKPVKFKEEDWVLVKEYYFLNNNKKLAKTI
jgi:hypothetical protein